MSGRALVPLLLALPPVVLGDAAICQPLCIPQNAWNGTQCVVAAAAAVDDGRVSGFAGWVFLGLLLAVGVVVGGSLATDYCLPAAAKRPDMAAMEEPVGEWIPARGALRHTADAAAYRAALREDLAALREVSKLDDAAINLLYSQRFDAVCAVRDALPDLGFSRALFEDGEWLWLPDSALLAPDGREGSRATSRAQSISPEAPPLLNPPPPPAGRSIPDTPVVAAAPAAAPPAGVRPVPSVPSVPTPPPRAAAASLATSEAATAAASPPVATPSKGAALPLFPPAPAPKKQRKRLKQAEVESDSD